VQVDHDEERRGAGGVQQRRIQPYSTSRMMYSTEANASSADGVKLMVSQTPVTIWLTSTSSASEPKKYRKLKFLGA
jgi:hypothetical protein